MKEPDRHGRGTRWVEDTRRDLRHTLRVLASNPGFAAVVVLTLGLGIGSATAVFSVVNAVVLRPLNAPDADRLVRSLSVNNGRSTDMPSAYALKVWKDLRDVFEDVSAHRLDSVPLMGVPQPEQVSVGRVSEPFFRLFGASVIAGRTFSPDEDRPKGAAVVVLSYGLWVRRFGADTNIVGQRVALGSVPHTVVGVVGSSFDSEQFEPRPDAWVPLQADPEHFDGGSIYQVTARLRPGVTPAAANAALAVEYARLTTPREGAPTQEASQGRWLAEPLQTAMARSARSSLNLLLGAVAFLLLIACSNVANLLLVRAETRKREMAIRAAIGAGRPRLVRQLLIESLVLSLSGGVVGLAIGVLAT
jgi:predicted permease